MCSINLLLYSNVSQTIFILQVTEGQVTYSYCLPHPPGYGRTSYISVLSILRTHYVSLPCPTYMIMDKLHIPSVCPTHQVTEGHITYLYYTLRIPTYLPHPHDYRRTSYISLLSAGYGRTHYISLLFAPPA